MSKTKAKKPASRKRIKEESPPSACDEDSGEEKKPVKTQKRLVDVSIRNFAMPKKPGIDNGGIYKKQLEARNTLILREKERLLADVTVPREERSDKLLKWECEIKGLAREGIRAILLQRLANHDAGLAVMTSKHESVVKSSSISAQQAVKGNGTRESIILRLGNGKGSEGLLALPHDLIRGKLLPMLSVFDLVCLARTCKYLCKGKKKDFLSAVKKKTTMNPLYTDASDAILDRSRALFGEQYGTRLAIGALMSVATNYESLPLGKRNHHATFTEWSGWDSSGHSYRHKEAKKMCSKFGVKYQADCDSESRNASVYLQERFPDVNQKAEGCLLERHPGKAWILRVCMEKYKSIEGFVEQRRLKKEKAELKAAEKTVLEQSAARRLAALNEYLELPLFTLGRENGAAAVSKYLSGASYRSALLDLSPCGGLFYSLYPDATLTKAHKKCTTHVYEAVPVKPESAGDRFRMLTKKGSLYGDLIRTANENGLSRYNLPYFEWVFTYLIGKCAGGYKNSLMGLSDKGASSFIPSACRLAATWKTCGIDQLRNPEHHLHSPEDLPSLDPGSKVVPLDRAPHCVILVIDAEGYAEIRILFVRQQIAFTEREIRPGKEKVGQREYTLTPETILDALPESDKKMKTKLRYKGIQLLKHGPPATLGWCSDSTQCLYLPASYQIDAGHPTSFGGVWYRAAWQPFAPISVIIK